MLFAAREVNFFPPSTLIQQTETVEARGSESSELLKTSDGNKKKKQSLELFRAYLTNRLGKRTYARAADRIYYLEQNRAFAGYRRREGRSEARRGK